MNEHAHALGAPSDWVRRWSHLTRAGGTVLDVACGHGRHLQWFARRGQAVTGVDRSAQALQSLSALAAQGAELVLADLEGEPWPLTEGGHPRRFDVVVVTNYLWRPLFPLLRGSLRDGGVLLYETFAEGNASVGKPSRPEFLLRPGELLELCAGLRIVAFEDGFRTDPDRFVQRIVAVQASPASDRGTSSAPDPARYQLPS